MAQNWKTMSYASGNVAVTDLTNFETNFSVLKSMFSGTSAPSATIAGQPWFDTTKKIMKIRNAANSNWQGVMYGDANHKMWVYLNSAPDGFTYDSGVTDRVVAVKGGSTYVTGGAGAGSWTMSGMSTNSNTHNHKWYTYVSTYGYSYNDAGNAIAMQNPVHSGGCIISSKGDPCGLSSDYWAKDATHTHSAITYTSSWRPAAAVGILVYPSL